MVIMSNMVLIIIFAIISLVVLFFIGKYVKRWINNVKSTI